MDGPRLARLSNHEGKITLNENATLLVLNAGSSSIKFALYDLPLSGRARLEGQIAGIGREPRFSIGGEDQIVPAAMPDHAAAIACLLDWLEAEGHGRSLAGVGHRVVHGGTKFAEPLRLNGSVIEYLATLNPLAPHHQPHNLAAIRAVASRLPKLAQIACFDTGFHSTLPEEARRLPLPAGFDARGLRRYGFHGLSYESIVTRLPALTGRMPRRLAIAHLGNGASMCAVFEGRSIATTMGFSTLDGLVMATRSGSLDPGLVLHLLREGRDLAEIEDLLYNRAGLLGLSGISADMKVLLESSAPAASAAIAFYCYRISRELGSLAATLDGLDALVFTGGVGENAAAIRAQVCRSAGWLGIALDEMANLTGRPRLTLADSPASAWVVPSDEQSVIATHTARLLGL
jgi:acetate kinase